VTGVPPDAPATVRLLREAVAENASWCSVVCAAHGVASADDGRVWVCAGPPPPFHPDAMTLVPQVPAQEVLAAVGGRRPAGVKDSFAEVDLSAGGFDVLFEASWIGLVDDVRAPLAGLRAVHDPTAGPDVVVLEVVRDGEVLGRGTGHRHRSVVGLSNVEAGAPLHLPDVVAALVHGVRGRFGPLPVVGYEHGEALDAAAAVGFSVLGPLRVWARPADPDRL
jgi:hypothetical protein